MKKLVIIALCMFSILLVGCTQGDNLSEVEEMRDSDDSNLAGEATKAEKKSCRRDNNCKDEFNNCVTLNSCRVLFPAGSAERIHCLNVCYDDALGLACIEGIYRATANQEGAQVCLNGYWVDVLPVDEIVKLDVVPNFEPTPSQEPTPEVCDGLDNDGDGEIDEADAIDVSTWYGDNDGDGYGSDQQLVQSCNPPLNYVAQGGDCDDGDPGKYLGFGC
jgi:hypothetical protein